MSAKCGVWLSHKEAFIVKIDDDACSVSRVASNAERRHRSTGGVRGDRPYAHRSAISGARDESNRRNEWRRHYESILEALPKNSELFVLGPGLARSGFVSYLKEHDVNGIDVKGCEPAEHLTQGQLVAKVKSAFGLETRVHA